MGNSHPKYTDVSVDTVPDVPAEAWIIDPQKQNKVDDGGIEIDDDEIDGAELPEEDDEVVIETGERPATAGRPARTPTARVAYAAEMGDLETLRQLIESKEVSTEAITEEDKQTPLILASSYGKVDCVRYLLSKGANVNAEDAYGCTALMWASANGYADCVSILLDNGAQVDIVSKRGMKTALHWACSNGQAAVVKVLLEKARPNLGLVGDITREATTWTALHWAASSANREVVEAVIQAGAVVHFPHQGLTPLHWAAAKRPALDQRWRHECPHKDQEKQAIISILRCLIEHGAHPRWVGESEESAVDVYGGEQLWKAEVGQLYLSRWGSDAAQHGGMNQPLHSARKGVSPRPASAAASRPGSAVNSRPKSAERTIELPSVIEDPKPLEEV